MIREVVVQLGDGLKIFPYPRSDMVLPQHAVGQARLRRRHIEKPPQARPAKAIKEVDGSGTVWMETLSMYTLYVAAPVKVLKANVSPATGVKPGMARFETSEVPP